MNAAGALNKIRRWLRWPLYGLLGLVGLALFATLALGLMLDRAPQYQSEIKTWVHVHTGFHLRFARLGAQLSWAGPELVFDQVELRSKDDATVLVAARSASLAMDPWGIIRNGNLLTARIRVDSPQIDIMRRGPRSFLLASQIELFPPQNAASRLDFASLPGGTLRIRDARITLHDWNSDLPVLLLPAVRLTLERRGDTLGLELRTSMPAPLAGSLHATMRAHELGAAQTTRWETHAYARDFSLPGWHRLLPDFSNAIDAGSASFDLLARGRGADLALAALDFGAYQVQVPGANGRATRFGELSGRLDLTHSGELWSINAQRVQALPPGRRDPPMQFVANWRIHDGQLRDLSAHANALDADRLAPASALLPEQTLRERVAALGISGQWTDPLLQYHGAANGTGATWRVNAGFSGVGLAPIGNKPGFAGVAGSIAGNERGGLLKLQANGAQLNWPDEFPQPVAVARLAATVAWARAADGFLLASSDADVQNADVTARGKFSLQTFDDGRPALVVLAADVLSANLAAAHRYLPHQHISPKALDWLNKAFIAGHVPHGQVVLRGPLKSFPFRDGNGLFLARFPVNEGILDYHAGWPRFEHLNVDAEFRNAGLQVRIRHGKLGDLEVDGGEGVFEDFKTGELHVKAHGHGDAQAALDFLRASPIDALVGHAFSAVQANGSVSADVDLFLPFKAFDQRRVLVDGHLDQVAASHAATNLSVTELSGDFTVDGPQVSSAELRGQSFGGPFQAHAREPHGRADKGTQLDVRGTAKVDDFISNYRLPAAWFGGTQVDWRTVVRLSPEPARERTIRITSNLQGLEVKLPAPLSKAADRSEPAVLELEWPRAAGMQLRFGWGSALRCIATMSADAGEHRIERADVVFGDATPAYAGEGVYLSGKLAALDLGEWLKLRGGRKLLPHDDSPLSSLHFRGAKFEFGELDYHGIAFRDVGVAVEPTEHAWNIDVSGDRSVGRIAIPTGTGSPWEIQMQRLDIVDREGGAAPGDPAQPQLTDPHAVPSVDFKVQQFAWNDHLIGTVDARLVQRAEGVELGHLEVQNPNFQFDATASWLGLGQGQTRLGGTLVSTSLQDTLQAFGIADVLRAKTARVEFDLNGLGPPSMGLLPTLNGVVKIDLTSGELVGVKPGAGRLLGLASLASLRRRLSLDFSDMTDKGLAFDTAHSSFDLRNGDAYTEDTLLKGPAAEIGMIGRVGLAKRDYDQTAVVTGKLGASLPVVASTLAGGPVLGAAVLVFTQVFKQPLKGLARGYYRITGSWDNPNVERVKSGEAAAAERQSEDSK